MKLITLSLLMLAALGCNPTEIKGRHPNGTILCLDVAEEPTETLDGRLAFQAFWVECRGAVDATSN